MSHRVTLIPGDGVGPEIARDAPRHRRCRRGHRLGGGRGRCRGLPARRHHRVCRARRPIRSPGPGSRSRARSRPRSGFGEKIGQRDAAQAVRDLREHPSGAAAPGRAHPLRRRGRRLHRRSREHRGPLRRGRVPRYPRRGRSPEDHQPAWLGEDHPLCLRAGPPRGPRQGHLRHEGQHPQAHGRPLQARLRGARAGVPRDRAAASHHRQRGPPDGQGSRPVRHRRDHEPGRRHHQRPGLGARRAASASRPPATTATRWPSSRPSTARRRSTPARTSSTPRRSSSARS